jgi:CheY-like chemotaxis protein
LKLDPGAPLVLVVEDNPQASELLIRNLNRGGYQTVLARDGAEAIAKAQELKPAAITLDILLPDVDGWTVLGRLKQDPATRDVPVIVVSIVDDPDLGLALGAIDYLVKPVEPKQLLETIGRYSGVRSREESPITVLVVDDEPANRTWIQSLLEPAGYRVKTAAGGKEALDLLQTERLDLIVLDLMMPGMTGFELLDAIRTDERTRSLPILVITAKDLTPAERRELNGRVAAVLSHASDPADLLKLLGTLVPQPAALAAS